VAGGESSAGALDTLTILFTDIVGSTALRADLGEEAAEVVRRAHDSLVAEVVAGHGGRIVKGLEKLPAEERRRLVDESIVSDLSTLDPEYVARIRTRGRELLEARGVDVPPSG
jgi:hypothetical protein